jgi:hypothetical protein
MSKSITIENSNLKFSNTEDSDLNFFGLIVDNTYLQIPAGNTLQRPSNSQQGMIRFNSETNSLEGYTGSIWTNLRS